MTMDLPYICSWEFRDPCDKLLDDSWDKVLGDFWTTLLWEICDPWDKMLINFWETSFLPQRPHSPISIPYQLCN